MEGHYDEDRETCRKFLTDFYSEQVDEGGRKRKVFKYADQLVRQHDRRARDRTSHETFFVLISIEYTSIYK
jgi:hypothetical protein